MMTPNALNMKLFQPVFERYGEHQIADFYHFTDELSEQFHGVLGQSMFVEVCYVDAKWQVEVGNLSQFSYSLHEFRDDLREDAHFYLFDSKREAMAMVSDLLQAIEH